MPRPNNAYSSKKAVIPSDQQYSNIGGKNTPVPKGGLDLNPKVPAFEKVQPKRQRGFRF